MSKAKEETTKEELERVDQSDVRRLVDNAIPVAERLRKEGKLFDASVIDALARLGAMVIAGIVISLAERAEEPPEAESARPRRGRSRAKLPPGVGVSASDEPDQVSHAQSAMDRTKTWCGLRLIGGEDGRGQLRAHEFLIDTVEPGLAQAGLLAGMSTACRLCISNARHAGILIDVEPGTVDPPVSEEEPFRSPIDKAVGR